MNTIIENLKLENTAIQLTYSKQHEGFAEYALGKKGDFLVDVKSINMTTMEVDSSTIDIVETEEEAISLVKQFQKGFRKHTGMSLRKKGILSSGFPMWAN